MEKDSFISRHRILSATLIVTLAILLSKISGLVRDQVMAGYFGMTLETDAFTWAYFIPNLFKVLFAESLIVAAFIPIYSSYLKRNQREQMGSFVNSVGSIMVMVFSFLAVIIFILSPQIGQVLSSVANHQLDVGNFVLMNRIMVLSVVTLSLSGLATGILNSHNLFTLPAIAPLVMNLATVGFVIMLARQLGIVSMAIGAMAGSILHLLVQAPQMKVSGIRYRFGIDLKQKAVREMFSLMFPILLSLGAVQLNNSIDYFFALNLGPGNTTALTLSWRVANMPLGIFSVAVITVLFPLFSRQAASGDTRGLKESFSLGVREIGYMMLPASVGLVILSRPIIQVLFEHYMFSPEDTRTVAFILVFHSLGLLFFGLLMILNRIFYAFKNVKTPLKVASVSIVVNFFMDWLLIRFLDVGGLALSTSFVALFNTGVLLYILRKKLGNLGGKRIFVSYGKMALSASVMGACVYLLWRMLEGFAQRGLTQLIVSLGAAIFAGGAIYILMTFLFKMEEVRFVKNMMKKFKDKGFKR